MDVKDYVKKEIRLTKILTNEVNSELVRTYNGKADDEHDNLISLRESINSRLETLFLVYKPILSCFVKEEKYNHEMTLKETKECIDLLTNL